MTKGCLHPAEAAPSLPPAEGGCREAQGSPAWVVPAMVAVHAAREGGGWWLQATSAEGPPSLPQPGRSGPQDTRRSAAVAAAAPSPRRGLTTAPCPEPMGPAARAAPAPSANNPRRLRKSGVCSGARRKSCRQEARAGAPAPVRHFPSLAPHARCSRFRERQRVGGKAGSTGWKRG